MAKKKHEIPSPPIGITKEQEKEENNLYEKAKAKKMEAIKSAVKK